MLAHLNTRSKTGSMLFLTLALLVTPSIGELIVFTNSNPSFGSMLHFDPNFGHFIEGQSLDITRDSFNQPGIGQTPNGSIYFMHIEDLAGNFIWMGTGRLTDTARAEEGSPILDPWAGLPIDYFGPQQFGEGGIVDSDAMFVAGWRAIHGYNDLTGTPGVFTVEDSFDVGIRFELDDGTHFGFASFTRSFKVVDDRVLVEITPRVWGYESIAGVGARVVPSPASAGMLLLGCSATMIRRRRR